MLGVSEKLEGKIDLGLSVVFPDTETKRDRDAPIRPAEHDNVHAQHGSRLLRRVDPEDILDHSRILFFDDRIVDDEKATLQFAKQSADTRHEECLPDGCRMGEQSGELVVASSITEDRGHHGAGEF